MLKTRYNLSVRKSGLFATPWPYIWVWIFLAIIVLGLANPTNLILTVIKVGGILLCFAYTIITFPRDRWLQLALGVTFLADIILAINNTAEAGVLLFLCAQLIHLIRLEGKRVRSCIIVFCTLLLLILGTNFAWQFAPMMYPICGFYLIVLFTNIICSIFWRRREPQNLVALFAVLGFCLFLCCDICTGLSYLSLNNFLPAFVYAPANYFAWFFYYPSQILLSNSSKCVKISPKRR